MRYQKPNLFFYRIAQAVSWLAATVIFRRQILRNEIKGKKGPFVVIANHQAALDFVNLIGATARPMTFVISNSFYSTLPIKGFLDKMGVIPKQQFQTSVKDLKRIKAVIDRGEPVVIYPAGLMCEDGLSTPIPAATYKLLQWLGVDVYIAKTTGTYFVMPKWAKGFRPGRTYLDIRLLFSKEDLEALDPSKIRELTQQALRFDAYREQDQYQIKYLHARRIEGLENVLYQCPNCMTEFSMGVRDHSTLCCSSCGYEQVSDQYGFLHNQKGVGPELRYVSDWSSMISRKLEADIVSGSVTGLSLPCQVRMIDPKKHKFTAVGSGTLAIDKEHISLTGQIHGQEQHLQVSVASLPSLPFSPGKYLELQHGCHIYRCYPDDGRLVMKCINLLKIFHTMYRAKLPEPAAQK